MTGWEVLETIQLAVNTHCSTLAATRIEGEDALGIETTSGERYVIVAEAD